MKTFGAVVREQRRGLPRTQADVATMGGLEQARISEIEHDTYLPGLDLAARLAKGLSVSLTALVARWEGVSAAQAELGADVPDEALFRRLRGLWEDMTPETRARFCAEGRRLLRAQWDAEQETPAAAATGRARRRRRPAKSA